MDIVIGSFNQTKIHAVQATFPNDQVIAEDVPSNVSAQPIGDEETMQGAKNRARNAHVLHKNSISIGLEGGIMMIHDELYLCNWGALLTAEGKMFTASGARIQLPHTFITPLQKGTELSELMDAYTRKHGIRNYEGAIGIFTNGLMLRHEMFMHVVTLLKGQYYYWRENKD